jgi:hypothetical protein
MANHRKKNPLRFFTKGELTWALAGEIYAIPTGATSIALYNVIGEHIGSDWLTFWVCFLVSSAFGTTLSLLFLWVMRHNRSSMYVEQR